MRRALSERVRRRASNCVGAHSFIHACMHVTGRALFLCVCVPTRVADGDARDATDGLDRVVVVARVAVRVVAGRVVAGRRARGEKGVGRARTGRAGTGRGDAENASGGDDDARGDRGERGGG